MAKLLDSDHPTLYLHPGEIYFAKEPTKVITVLGSCLSITMYYKKLGIGAISHATLPFNKEPQKGGRGIHKDVRFVDESVEWMIRQFENINANRAEIEVKMFGGAEIFGGNIQGNSPLTVGKRNIETAIVILQREQLKLNAWNVGGNQGRKIFFYTDTGDIFIQLLSSSFFEENLLESKDR